MPSENSPEMRKRAENARKMKNSSRPMTGPEGQMKRDLKGLKKVGYTGIWEANNKSELASQARAATSGPRDKMNMKYYVEDKRTGPQYAAKAALKKAADRIRKTGMTKKDMRSE